MKVFNKVSKVFLVLMLVCTMSLGNVEYVNATEWVEVASTTITFYNLDEDIKSTRVVYDGNNVYAEAIVEGRSEYTGDFYERIYKTKSVTRKSGTSYKVNIGHKELTPPVPGTGEKYVRRVLSLMESLNTPPKLDIIIPIENNYFGKGKPINISGTVKDEDSGDILSIKYTINGISAHTNKTLQTVTADGENQSFSKIIAIDNSIPQGTYNLKVWVEDNKGGKSSEIIKIIKVDKTSPTLKIIVGK